MRKSYVHICVGMMGLLACAPALAQMKDLPHPFLLWTKEEAAAIKQRIDTDPLAKKQYERMLDMEGGKRGKGSGSPTVLNLFKYMVLGDQKAGESEKRALLGFIGRVPEPMTAEFKAEIQKRLDAVGGDWDKIWTRGNASFADRHMRDEQTLNTLRYDVFYNELAPEERAGVEKALKAYIQFHLDGHKPWHADFKYGKMSWLPNMSWPRAIGTHIMAIALRDQKLIEAMFNSTGGYKWFMDEYVSDGRFYNEEFGKYYSNIGSMLMYCEALHRVGLDQYGWGYTGKGGGSMRNFLESMFWIGYPRTDIAGGMANFRRVTMGDAKGAPFGMAGLGEHSIVGGYLPDGTGGDAWWGGGNMNGPLPKMAAPMWYEVGHRRFPDGGYDYFLAAMRAPGEDVYLPSLYWGLGPIDPKKAKPPTVQSFLAMQRGFAFLKAEESPAYWESPAPAVAQQFGFYYAHYAHDCFTILGYQAFNRPIYVNAYGGSANHYINEHIRSGPPTGYIGRHPWLDTTRGHCSVTVDCLQARPVESGEEGLKNHRMRHAFSPLVKYVAGRTKGIYPDVDQERALFLTRQYLFDAFWLSSNRQRLYDWAVHGPGGHQFTPDWKATNELYGSMLYREYPATQPVAPKDTPEGNDLEEVRKLVPGDAPWSDTILQTCALPEGAKIRLPKAFYDRGVGVRVSMLGEKGTTVFAGRPPGGHGELAGATLLVRREAPVTAFVALHEPFEGGVGKHQIDRFERIAQNAQGVAASAVGKPGSGIDDRILFRYGDDADKSISLSNGRESFTFSDYGFIRIAPDRVDIVGNVTAVKVAVAGNPKLFVNGKETPATVAGGVMVFGP